MSLERSRFGCDNIKKGSYRNGVWWRKDERTHRRKERQKTSDNRSLSTMWKNEAWVNKSPSNELFMKIHQRNVSWRRRDKLQFTRNEQPLPVGRCKGQPELRQGQELRSQNARRCLSAIKTLINKSVLLSEERPWIMYVPCVNSIVPMLQALTVLSCRCKRTIYRHDDVVREISWGQLRAMRCARNVARTRYKMLIGKPEGKTSLGRTRRRWEDSIIETGRDNLTAYDTGEWRAVVSTEMHLRHPQKTGNLFTSSATTSLSTTLALQVRFGLYEGFSQICVLFPPSP